MKPRFSRRSYVVAVLVVNCLLREPGKQGACIPKARNTAKASNVVPGVGTPQCYINGNVLRYCCSLEPPSQRCGPQGRLLFSCRSLRPVHVVHTPSRASEWAFHLAWTQKPSPSLLHALLPYPPYVPTRSCGVVVASKVSLRL